ncbi:MAG: phosphate acetyltransferase [Defluviitaleaceae bacterium]|nr:phosphate acetyltransferase [Defluviitaleaceae bacterium]
MDFLKQIKEIASSKKVNIVLPETNDERILLASEIIIKENICDLTLIGDKKEIINLGYNLEKANFLNPKEDDLSEISKQLYEIRKNKGITEEEANDLIKNPLYLSVMLIKTKKTHGMVAGAINSTSDVLRPSLQILKTDSNSKIVSSFFIMIVEGFKDPFIFADCALIQMPNSNELSEIAASSARTYKQIFNKEPNVAFLSHSSFGSAKHDMVSIVKEAVKISKEKYPEINMDGELQLDAAIVPSVAKIKAPNSTVAGRANVLIFPNIDSANIGYKLVQRFAKAQAYGPITQGLSYPVNDLSRGCSVEDIVGVTAITAFQAQKFI